MNEYWIWRSYLNKRIPMALDMPILDNYHSDVVRQLKNYSTIAHRISNTSCSIGSVRLRMLQPKWIMYCQMRRKYYRSKWRLAFKGAWKACGRICARGNSRRPFAALWRISASSIISMTDQRWKETLARARTGCKKHAWTLSNMSSPVWMARLMNQSDMSAYSHYMQ